MFAQKLVKKWTSSNKKNQRAVYIYKKVFVRR